MYPSHIYIADSTDRVSPAKSYTKSPPRGQSPIISEPSKSDQIIDPGIATTSAISYSNSTPKIGPSKFTCTTSLRISSPLPRPDTSTTSTSTGSYYREKAKLKVISGSTVTTTNSPTKPPSPPLSPPASPTASSINAALLYELLCSKSKTDKTTAVSNDHAHSRNSAPHTNNPLSTPQLPRKSVSSAYPTRRSVTGVLSRGTSRAASDTDDSETAFARLSSRGGHSPHSAHQHQRSATTTCSTTPTTPTPSRRRPTVARANRTLELRKARLSRESGGESTQDKDCATTSSSVSRVANRCTNSKTTTTTSYSASASRTASRESTTRAAIPSNTRRASKDVSGDALNRRDGGRFSMRLTGSKRTDVEPGSPAPARRRSGTGISGTVVGANGAGTGTSGSQMGDRASAVKAARTTLARSRSNVEPSPSSSLTGLARDSRTTASSGCGAGTGATTSAANSWRRRKTYDPRKAVNEAKVQQRRNLRSTQRTASSAEASSTSDFERECEESEEGACPVNRDHHSDIPSSQELAERIKQLSSTVTQDMQALTMDAIIADDEVALVNHRFVF